MTKRILFITYFFPPFQAVASNRTEGIVKYLHKLGYEVTVLTTDHIDTTSENYKVIKTECPRFVLDREKKSGLKESLKRRYEYFELRVSESACMAR